jgi:hypothetical protein
MDEGGLPEFYVSVWSGLWAKGTLEAVVSKLNSAVVDALAKGRSASADGFGRGGSRSRSAFRGGSRGIAGGGNPKVLADRPGNELASEVACRNARFCELPRDKAFPAGLRSLVARPTVQRVWLLFLVADASSFLHQYETSRLIKAPGEHVALECPNKELIKFALSNL